MRRDDHRRLPSVGKYPLSSSLHDGIFDHDYNDHDDNVDNNGEYQTIPTIPSSLHEGSTSTLDFGDNDNDDHCQHHHHSALYAVRACGEPTSPTWTS